MPTLRPRPLTMLFAPATATLLLALIGCSDTAEIPRADPVPSVTPLFASEEEALEAATAVYADFLQTTGMILQEGGLGADRLRGLVSKDVFDQENEGFLELQRTGGRTEGFVQLNGILSQQSELGPSASFELQAYVCVANTGTTLFDAEGNDITDPDRVSVGTFDVVFTSSDIGELIIARKDYWSDGDQCGA